jgi:hypothetical protein
MNNLLQSLLNSQGGVEGLARQFGLSQDQASGAVSSILNQLQGSAGEGGLAPLLESLLSGGGAGLQGLATKAAAESGVDPSVIERMLPQIGQLVTGLLQGGQGGDILSALAGILDSDKDGSVVDDVLDIGRKLL